MRRLVLALARVPVALFYRRWDLGGAVPDKGPLVIVANHPNGLVDPVLVAARTRRPLRFLAKEPLFRMPVVGALVRALGSLPLYRSLDGADTAQNERTFAAVYDALAGGDAVCLFPEGTSHSEPSLQKLKTGAARMALGAEARERFRLGVRVLPVGLVYAAKARFRSKVATWVGEPVSVDDLHARWERDPRAAVQELTRRVADGLRAVTLNLDRWEDLPLVEVAEQLWRPGEGRRVPRLAAMARGLSELRRREPERIERLERELSAFAALLARLGVAPGDLELRYRSSSVVRFALTRSLELVAGVPLAAAGWLVWAVPWYAVRALRRAVRVSEDLRATAVLLAAMVVYPLWLVALVGAAGVAYGTAAAAVAALVAPALGVAGLRLAERRAAAFEDAATFLRLVSARSLSARLRRRKEELAGEIEALAGRLGVP